MPDLYADLGATEELTAIVRRARQLGFSTERVATALRISPEGLASIQDRISAIDGPAESPAPWATRRF